MKTLLEMVLFFLTATDDELKKYRIPETQFPELNSIRYMGLVLMLMVEISEDDKKKLVAAMGEVARNNMDSIDLDTALADILVRLGLTEVFFNLVADTDEGEHAFDDVLDNLKAMGFEIPKDFTPFKTPEPVEVAPEEPTPVA